MRGSVAPLSSAPDGVAVVAAEEEDGRLQGGGKVECSVEVALGGGALAEVAGDDAVFAALLQRIGGSGGLGQLRPQRGGDGLEVEGCTAVVHWHLATLAEVVLVAKALPAGR